jgi:hypothetical protein
MVGAIIVSTHVVCITELSGQVASIPIGCLWILTTATSNIIGEAKVTQV